MSDHADGGGGDVNDANDCAKREMVSDGESADESQRVNGDGGRALLFHCRIY